MQKNSIRKLTRKRFKKLGPGQQDSTTASFCTEVTVNFEQPPHFIGVDPTLLVVQ